jgi:hypothetical protein
VVGGGGEAAATTTLMSALPPLSRLDGRGVRG